MISSPPSIRWHGCSNATPARLVTLHPCRGCRDRLYTDGTFPSGDFDVVASLTDAFDRAMLAEWFCREDRAGPLHIGFHHPDHPRFGYQQVSGRPFDRLSETGRLLCIVVTASEAAVAVPAIEDMIADRLGQYAAGVPSDTSRSRQARLLLKLASHVDMDYLLRQIGDEGGNPSLLDVPPPS